MKAEKIDLQNLSNTRDLGSIINKDGCQIRERMLLRSGELSYASTSDLITLYRDYNLRHVVDFRSTEEMIERPDKRYRDISYLALPVMPERASGIMRDAETELEIEMSKRAYYDPENARIRMMYFYRTMVSHEYCLKQYQQFIQALLEREGAILWHCAMGKDRAGIAAMIVEMLLDVDEETIIEDYLYTNRCYYGRRKMTHSFSDYYNYANEEYIKASLDTIKKTFGSTEAFIRNGLKISAEEQKQFQEKYLR